MAQPGIEAGAGIEWNKLVEGKNKGNHQEVGQ